MLYILWIDIEKRKQTPWRTINFKLRIQQYILQKKTHLHDK